MGFLDAILHHLFHGRITYLDSSRVLDAELRPLILPFHDEGLQHLHRGTTILMQLLLAGVLVLQQVELVAELRLVLMKSQDFAGRLILRVNALLQQHHQAGGQLPLLIELSGHAIEALLQQLHQALDDLLLLIEVLIELIGHAVEV